jgi:uncharacterized repeat protein (TIGR03803 family)
MKKTTNRSILKNTNLVLTAAISLMIASVQSGGAGPLALLYTFPGPGSGPLGSSPNGGLVWRGDGTFLGTTSQGGEYGYGDIYSISPAAFYPQNVLSYFNGTDYFGGNPMAGATIYGPLDPGSTNAFYCTCYAKGLYNAGAVFAVYGDGQYVSYYDFGFVTNDGANPEGAVIVGGDGNVYGTTAAGGTNGDGTVYEIVTNVFYTFAGASVIHSFQGTADGYHPYGSLTLGSDGNLYGTTLYGGSNGFGTVFSMVFTNGAWAFRTLHHFTGGSDGGYPNGGLVQGGPGLTFYGTTHYGGSAPNPGVSGGGGTVYKITAIGELTSLYSFGDTYANGPLIFGTDGNLYGVTSAGVHASTNGSVFQITSAGAFNTIYQFNGTDGRNPSGALLQYNDNVNNGYGYLYGTTRQGGTNFNGTIFALLVTNLAMSGQIAPTPGFGPSSVNLRTPSSAGVVYQLQYADSVNSAVWMNLGPPVLGTGGIITLTDPDGSYATRQTRYYRIVTTNP